MALGRSPPAPSHTLPVNHPNFIDITGIANETPSVSQLAVPVDLLQGITRKRTQTCMKYTVRPHPPRFMYTQQPLPVCSLVTCE